jgi:hypothetical protein
MKNMKLDVVRKIDLRIERYDSEIQSFWEKERAAISLAKKTFLKELGAINVFNPCNPRYFLGKKNSSDKIYISYSILYPKILKTIYDVCIIEDNKNDSAELILRKIFNSEELLTRIFQFDKGYVPYFLKDYDSFEKKIRAETLLYFDDGEEKFYFELFRKFDKSKIFQEKQEFTGGFLHILTKHFEYFNHYHPQSNDSLDFEFSDFTFSIIDISVNGIEKRKDFKKDNEYIIEKEMNLKDYFPTEEDKIFKVSLYKQTNGINFLTTFYRY